MNELFHIQHGNNGIAPDPAQWPAVHHELDANRLIHRMWRDLASMRQQMREMDQRLNRLEAETAGWEDFGPR